MLKIKDNVDLKELKKFGFEESSLHNDEVYYFLFRINTKTRQILYIGCEFELLFDLITADLVEKCDEKPNNIFRCA